jgi:2-aminoadipate transaminase
MNINIDKTSSIPMYRQIVSQIRKQILSGELAVGYKLPPERRLAEATGVNRTTVLNAYRELKSENLIGSHVGRGTVVLPFSDDGIYPVGSYISHVPIWSQFYSDYSNGFDSYAIGNLRKLINIDNVISFATGTPNPENIPKDIFHQIGQQLIDEKLLTSELASPIEGYTTLRKCIAEYMGKRGCACNADEVMVISGSQQGIDLTVRALINPGDVIIVEEPSFFPAIQVFRMAGARLMSIPVDEAGMQVDILEGFLLRYRPKLIYSIPSYQNPSGVELSMKRRTRLLELAMKYKVLILEDDAYGALHYEGKPLPCLKSMENAGFVIYLSTFSKIVNPGLRTGWIVAHKEYIRRFSSIRQMVDFHTSCFSQRICEKLFVDQRLEKHLSSISKKYKTHRDAMLDALETYAPKRMSWYIPKGGYYVWCKLPEGVSALKLLAMTTENNVIFMPGNLFYLSGQEDRYIRLNFVYTAKNDIPRGVKVICDAVRTLLQDINESTLKSVFETKPIL